MRPASIRTRLRQWRTHIATDIDRLRGFPTLRRRFHRNHGYDPNLSDPRTFNEKLQWRKLYDHNPLFPVLMDKVRMPDWARRKLPPTDHHVLPTYLQVARRADEIDFTALPADIALKANHASGWNVLLRAGEPFDEDQVRRRLDTWMSRRFGKTPELHASGYLSIPPRIAVQELLLKADGTLADDIRLHFFGSQFGFGQIGSSTRDHLRQVTYFDENWTVLDVSAGKPRHDPPIARPTRIDDLLRIARTLASHLDYMRVDFMCTEDNCVLGELTMCHTSGLLPLRPVSFDRDMGDLWKLPAQSGRQRAP